MYKAESKGRKIKKNQELCINLNKAESKGRKIKNRTALVNCVRKMVAHDVMHDVSEESGER